MRESQLEVVKDRVGHVRRHHLNTLLGPGITSFSISGVGDRLSAVDLLLARSLVTGGVVEGVTQAVREVGRVRRHHLHCLVLHQISSFSMSCVGETFIALELLNQKCSRLKQLNLSYLRNVGPPVLMKLIPTLTNVTHLNLSMTQTVDQIMGLIGEYCPLLRDLDISNTIVMDEGLMRLCYNCATNSAQCTNLTRISVAGCSVTARAIAILLQYLPKLTHIDYEQMFDVFGVLEEWGATPANANSCDKYQLRVLTSSSEQVDAYTVDLAVTLCPQVMEFTMSNAWVDNSVLYPAMRLEHLAHLRLTNCDGLTLNFQEGVLPLLTVKGSQLISLLLANFTSVDLAAIGECCPRLQNLALSAISLYDDIMYPRENCFNSLVNVEVWTSVTTDSCNSIILRQLLGYCPGLENLLVKGADALSDKLFLDLWRINEMRRLSRLTLDTCHNVTSNTIHQLLDTQNNLTLVRIWSCFFISKDDYQQLLKRVDTENCDLYVEWYSWNG
ncbi:hypothetical protein Pcinc_021725 [Petrolisthes cinctipes]|uniref:F-box/LRR-repeat protein 2 n=1 Tax=Petrolisthes cinctipes TaxID=88211 RepID=A0AAE1FFE5_PETCI|nr:hypothetical protein Pcinc_021725 [Petrolisthes cinctipes]